LQSISIKIRHNGKIINKTIYLVIGLTQEGMKQVLGMWVAPTESAAFWMSVLTDLKSRGVEDILIASSALFIRSVTHSDTLSGKRRRSLPRT